MCFHWFLKSCLSSFAFCHLLCRNLYPTIYSKAGFPVFVKLVSLNMYTNYTFNGLYQVSTSSVVEGKDLPTRSSSENVKVSSLDSDSNRIIAVHYVLEESSGYMEPTLRILAILHTVISFFCIIGYYCLKVR